MRRTKAELSSGNPAAEAVCLPAPCWATPTTPTRLTSLSGRKEPPPARAWVTHRPSLKSRVYKGLSTPEISFLCWIFLQRCFFFAVVFWSHLLVTVPFFLLKRNCSNFLPHTILEEWIWLRRKSFQSTVLFVQWFKISCTTELEQQEHTVKVSSIVSSLEMRKCFHLWMFFMPFRWHRKQQRNCNFIECMFLLLEKFIINDITGTEPLSLK